MFQIYTFILCVYPAIYIYNILYYGYDNESDLYRTN